MPEDLVVAHLDKAIRDRLVNIEQFKVTEDYRVYRNGGNDSAAHRVLRAEYQKNLGVSYVEVPIPNRGSSLLQSRAIEPPLNSDRQANDPKMRYQLALTSDNYDFRLEPNSTLLDGRNCLILDISARRKSFYLLNGKAWLDARTLSLIRIQGVQSLRLSFWAGSPVITRDYEDVSGFSVVTREKIEAHSYLFGETIVKIEYQGYEILRAPK